MLKMQGDFYYRFLSAITAPRLNMYRGNSYSDLDVVSRYLWNIAIAEAFYPSLNAFEIGLRNSVHNALTYRFGRPDWYDDKWLFLDEKAMASIEEAKSELRAAGKPLEPGRMVAELSFGFWASLFNRKYERPESRLWPQLLHRVFPCKPRSVYLRHHVASRIEEVRRFRNRAFHHERIIHLDLQKIHAETLETVSWINPALHYATTTNCRFNKTFTLGWMETRRLLLTPTLPPDYEI